MDAVDRLLMFLSDWGQLDISRLVISTGSCHVKHDLPLLPVGSAVINHDRPSCDLQNLHLTIHMITLCLKNK